MKANHERARAKAVALSAAHAYAPLPLTPLPRQKRRPPGGWRDDRKPKLRARNPAPAKRQKKTVHPIVRALRHFFLSTALAIGVGAGVMSGAFDGLTPAKWRLPISTSHAAVAQASTVGQVWEVDLDGDGVADLANPTHEGIRGVDAYGSGAFHAERDGGKREHLGADFIAAPGSVVYAPLSGVMTREGHAYGKDGYLRFIELTDAPMHMATRVFYVDPLIKIGQTVKAGEPIGYAQTLAFKYPRGITNHVHVELSDQHGAKIDPAKVLPPARIDALFAALHAGQAANLGG